MATDKVYNLIILDESGSMSSIKKATISGFNEVVQTIKGIEKKFLEQEHFISLVSFNGLGIKTLLDKQPAASLSLIDEKTYQPDSMTPLYDAIALSVLRLKVDVSGIKNVNVLVTILTDGEENASKEFSHSQVNGIISEMKKLGWTFTYIGANHDVEKVAHSISITNTMVFEANEQDMHLLFHKENKARMNYSQKLYNKVDDLQTGYYDEPEEKEDRKEV
jgi:hypothetical protein